MAKTGEQTLRLFFMYQFFLKNARKEHLVSRNDVFKAMEDLEVGGTSARTFLSDVALLRQEPFSLDLQYDERNHGWYLDNPPFDLKELKLMIDSVQASNFITQKYADSISQKIRSLVGEAQQRELTRSAFVSERVRSMNESAVFGADSIREAIAENRKITFRYFHRLPTRTKERKYSKKGDTLEVSPFAMLWDSGYYYLYAFNGTQFKTYRIDRMDGIRISPSKREGMSEYRKADLIDRKAKVFGMYRGEVANVSCVCHNTMADAVIDKFGEGISFGIVDEEHFRFSADIELSPPFFAWVATFGRKIKIISPTKAVDKMKSFLTVSSSMYSEENKT